MKWGGLKMIKPMVDFERFKLSMHEYVSKHPDQEDRVLWMLMLLKIYVVDVEVEDGKSM